MANIIGRQQEQQYLKRAYEAKSAQFIAVYGRRRVGKTFLIRAYFETKDCIFMQVIGKKDGTLEDQLAIFTEALEAAFFANFGLKIQRPPNWHEAFKLLTAAIDELSASKKIVLFFDELPWLATRRSGLLQELDYFWNRYWCDNPRVKLIICGSAAAWIIDNIINARGGLHNRLTGQILLQPFNLAEVKDYLKANKFRYGVKQILNLYMMLGGIPYYLSLLDPKFSVQQNVEQLCFQAGGNLTNEFDNLFSSLFEQANAHEELVKIMAKSHSGVERSELVKRAKLSKDGGTLSKRLQELEAAGFITTFKPMDKQRGVYYKLIDEFTLFYLDWVSPIKGKPIDKEYWQEKTKSQTYKIWSGYAFEMLCYKHIEQIRKALKIPGGTVVENWRFVGKQDDRLSNGAQIDLLFDRDDGVINLCEIKYTDKPFAIDKAYSQRLLAKADVLRNKTKIKKDIFFTMVSANGLQETMYSEELITAVAVAEDLMTE
ncbi:MAG: AAA family ATPase [Legionellales bacterium]|nr:AAA family ATPase [Legionellales bacterium]|tara:strand:+ start:4829 stop:6289 length:1461 start_codon:yes stop_codon:yes gene_type:complete